MIIPNRNMATGEIVSLDLNVTAEQLQEYANGALIQEAFGHLPPCEREFIKTGFSPQYWAETFNGCGNVGNSLHKECTINTNGFCTKYRCRPRPVEDDEPDVEQQAQSDFAQDGHNNN